MKYEIIYSDRKTISLSIKDANLIVRAPKKTSKEKIEEVVVSHKMWIEKHIANQIEKAKRHPEPTACEESELRRAARAALTAKTKYYSEIMGLKYGRITITGAKTRFGSCSSKGNISFSYRLMTYPDAAIDYVVVHELAHLVEMNHSSRFYAIVEKILPDYKERRKLLKF